MKPKLNAFFIIAMLLFSMFPVQAAPPTQYHEIKNCDVELRGAIFIDVDPSSFYASYKDGIIQIDSSVHFENVGIRFKGIALDSKLKKYNGFNVGYTHISDDGVETHELKPLEIDYQGFAYLITDFSTVIINGMTGTTTTALTNQTGNISIGVPNGTLYDLNITNNQLGLWTAESDIWGNTSTFKNRTAYIINRSGAISDYQIKLNNTVSDSDRWTYENGTYIPNWNETLLNVWVKASLDDGNTTLYKYDGNDELGSASGGSDVFIQWHGEATNGFVDTLLPDLISDVVFEGKVRATSAIHNINWGLASLSENEGGDRVSIKSYSASSDIYGYCEDGVSAKTLVQFNAYSFTQNQWYKLKIINDGTTVHFYFDDIEIATGSTTTLPNNNMGLQFHIQTGTGGQEYSFARKYTLGESPYTIGTPQQVQGLANITAAITGDSNTQQYNTSQSREFTLTPTGTTNNVNINTTSTDYDITIITYWTDDTILQTETINNGYANQTINYTSNDYNVSADLNTTYTFNFSAQDYIGTSTSTLNDVSKPTYRSEQDVNASVGELIAGVNNWWNVTVLYNNIPVLSNQSDTTAFLGVSKAFTDSTYNDPDSNPILSRLWNFGDGTNSSSSNPSHTYTSLGNLNANYTVTEDAATNSQTITKEFNVSVAVQPVQNIISTLDQTWIKFNWSDYSSADLWNIYKLEESAPYTNETLVLDGIKDSAYDTYAHAFVFDTPNPQSNLNYETVHWLRDDTHLHGYADGYDADTKINDDYFKIGIDNTGDGLTADDRIYKLAESGSVTAQRWSGTQWLPQATSALGVVVGAGVSGAIQYEMQIPLSELSGFVNGVTAKFMMERECTDLVPTVETFYPTNLINETDGSLWANATLTATPVYNYIGNTSISEYNSTGLTPYTWYRHQFITVNGSTNSTPVYHDDITVDVPHYSISGYIIDQSGIGIAGATVFAKNGVVGELTQSDVNGYYIGYNFEVGNYSIYANKSGYEENYISISVSSNLTNQNVTLQSFEMTDWMLWEKLLDIEEQNEALEDDIATLNSIIWVASLLCALVVISVIRKKIEEHE